MIKAILGTLVLLATLTACGIDLVTDPWQPPPAAAQKQPLLPRQACDNAVPQRQALFGDLHIHTAVSMDAYAMGTRTTPDDAYRYAMGEPIDVYSGDPRQGMRKVQIDRPLDFAAVTDHAEWMSEVALCTTPGSASYSSKGCKIFRGEEESWLAKIMGLKGFRKRIPGLIGPGGRRSDVCGEKDTLCRAELATVWQANKAATERWYDRSSRCEFTTFHGWEYSHSPQSTKVHRNIILRNEISPELPISSLETPVEMDLRHQLVELCNDTDSGCEAIAIPHNPNLSNGQLFRVEYADLPEQRQREEAALRARLEPIVEMMQIKGESECRNGMYQVLGSEDELCNFEKVRDIGRQSPDDCEAGAGSGAQKGEGCTSRTDYVRYALLEGLREDQRVGVNPYKFGFIGSTDTHMSTPGAVSEYDRPYKYGVAPERMALIDGARRGPAFWNPGGLAGVWAEENTRDAIFDALKRRETFATSGPRIVPRFYGGWDLPGDICDNSELPRLADAAGVPMGAVLPAAPAAGRAPVFVVSAQSDPGSAGQPGGLLQRVQLIKGWVGEGGAFHQRVFDIAGNADNGADVDLASCKPRGPGATRLCGLWQDPEFEPGQDAVYYARIVENPSCRWSTRLCLTLPEAERPDGCTSDQLPRTIQERAWTSPIWYSAGVQN